MLTAKSVLDKIKWDPNLNPGKFSVHYYDRKLNTLIEIGYEELTENNDNKDSTFSLPLHRVRKISYQGRVIWERLNNGK